MNAQEYKKIAAVEKGSETKRNVGNKLCCCIKSWSFLSGTLRLEYRDPNSSVFHRCSGHVDVRKATGEGARSVWSGARWALFRYRIGVWAGCFVGRTTQRTKHVLHMFCDRTVINIRHVACWSRGTAFSRKVEIPSQPAVCSRAVPLASEAVAFMLPVVTGHRQFWGSGIGIFPFSGTT